uniref:Uncharacterized protein n=1 Tax=Romanomermis culicivorax TaxID=13658 RepID=A0A915HGQ8_ROMCU
MLTNSGLIIEDNWKLSKESAVGLTSAYLFWNDRRSDLMQLLLTPAYLESKRIEAVSQNNKIYYGNNIPNFFLPATLSVQDDVPASIHTGSASGCPHLAQKSAIRQDPKKPVQKS